MGSVISNQYVTKTISQRSQGLTQKFKFIQYLLSIYIQVCIFQSGDSSDNGDGAEVPSGTM